MIRRVLLFEDDAVRTLAPLTTLRPTFSIRCGHFSLLDRLAEFIPGADFGLFVRPELEQVVREEHPNTSVNDPHWLARGPAWVLNGRCLPEISLLEGLSPGENCRSPNVFHWGLLTAEQLAALDATRPAESLNALPGAVSPPTGALLTYPWDVVAANPDWLIRDFKVRDRHGESESLPAQLALVGPRDQLFLHESARVDPFVVIDVTHGPVWISEEVRIQAFTRIEGPACIGPGCQLFRANIREGCSFGPVCRVGGEVEESLLHGYVNKYHDGFLGHSYVCPWVNLGALTTNSDLKNDYSTVGVPIAGQRIDSGQTKVGSFIGDHTKTALASLFNTGSSVGVMCQILPGGELLPKHLPAFSRVWHGHLEEIPGGYETGLKTAHAAMARRDKSLTPAMEQLLQLTFAQTAAERRSAIERSARPLG